MKASILERKIHKWFALIVGVQVLFWMLSGAFMVSISIDFIHGDSLVRNLNEPLPTDSSGLYSITDILHRFPQPVSINLESRNAVPYFVVRTVNETVLLDAHTGLLLSPMSRDQAVVLANYYYAGDGGVSDVVLLTDDDFLRQTRNPDDFEYYVCGPPLMLSATRDMLADFGIPESQVLFDDFGI